MEYIIIVIILAAILVLYVLFSKKTKLSSSQIKKIHQFINRINNETDYKRIIIDLDKLLDYILKQKGFKGTLGEKMKKARNLFSNNNDIWFAHKLRNKIAHDIDFCLREKDAQKAIKYFKKAFNDLGV